MDEKQQHHVAVLAGSMKAWLKHRDENANGKDADFCIGKVSGYIRALEEQYGQHIATQIKHAASAEARCEVPLHENLCG
jgi:hypothetical protein